MAKYSEEEIDAIIAEVQEGEEQYPTDPSTLLELLNDLSLYGEDEDEEISSV